MKHLSAILVSLLLSSFASAQLTCSVTSCGESCGPQLNLTYTPVGQAGNQTITMAGTGLHSSSLMAMAWAEQTLAVPLPGGCSILIDPIWSTLHTTDSSGSFTFSRTWPHWATGQFYMQMASIDLAASPQILTTNCKLGACF